MLKLTRGILKFANILTWLLGGILSSVILIYSFYSVEAYREYWITPDLYGQYDSSQIDFLVEVSRWDLFVMAYMAPFLHIIFTRLIVMIDDVANGIIFSQQNFVRLKTIGWSLLAIQLTEIVYGWLFFKWAFIFEDEYGWGPYPDSVGWFSVMLIFILAKVFKEGAAMRDDLEGTI